MTDRFATTRWSLVQAAGDSANPDSREALESLCAEYWPPVYVFVRRKGHDAELARELTQGFFTHLLETKAVKKADPARGRFRSFLMTSAGRYVRDEWRKDQAIKRGGGAAPLSFDVAGVENWYASSPRDHETPETVFDRRWAVSLLERVLERLGRRMDDAGHSDRFRTLKPFLTGDEIGSSYAPIAEKLDLSEGAVKVAVHRLRRDYGQLLRDEVAHTLSDPSMVNDEIRVLRQVLAGA